MAAAKRAREGEDLSTHPNLGKLRLYVQRWHSNVHPATVFSPFPTGDEVNGLAPLGTHKLHTAGPLQRGPIPFLIQPTMERHANANTLVQQQHHRRSTRQTVASSSSSRGTGFAYHPDTLLHERVGAREVERPERVGKTFEHLSALGLISLCSPLECKRATTKQLARVHTERHIDTVDQWGFAVELSGEQACVVGGDLYASAETSRAARLAAGGVTEAALAVARGDVQNAFALVRPPGHHCSSTTASGFCFFNNVAVAVRAAQHALELQQSQAPKETGGNAHNASSKAPRILIVDWDVHHCDGTEEVFYNDPSVCVFSIHQYGSKPQHTLRRRHQPAVTPTEAKALASLPDTTKQDITFDELLTGIDNDDLLEATDAAAQTLSVAPVVVAEESGDENHTTTTRPRRGGTIDFKALNATLNASDRDATAFFASAGLLKETTERIGNLSSSSSSASVGTRDDDDDTSSGGFDDDDSSAGVGGAKKKKERFDGDEDGATSTEEDVDRQSLFYPGTGHVHRTADDDESAAPPPAAGRNINVPWPTTGFGDLEYLAVLEELLVPVVDEFQPEMIFVSCGFDCAEGDLLGSMKVSPTGFRLMTKCVLSLCPKVVVALEGGYNVSQIAKSSEGVLRELLLASHAGEADFALPPSTMLWDRVEHTIREVREAQRPFWKTAFHAAPNQSS